MSDESSSEEGSVSSHSSDSEFDEGNVIDPTNIIPYDFEPELSAESSGDNGSEKESEEDDDVGENTLIRIGNTTGCTCTCCRSMETYQESLCCKDDVPEDIIGNNTCITQHEEFAIVCLNTAVLRTTLSMLNNLRGDRIEYENISYRYAGYRQFTWWIHNRLGQGVRRVIPSCAIWAIRDMYPDTDNNYVPYLEAREEEHRLR